ncbi:hypothetical protein JW933_04880, partial [candidate division FCPU426 bacterium]|nr:hypothetical protein [candidate division FCPU426 bacterium]
YNPQELDFENRRRQNVGGKEGGTAQLLRGNGKALVPEKNARYWRRRQKSSLLAMKGEDHENRIDL